MKHLIIILLVSLSLQAKCLNWISKAEAIKSINKVPNAGAIPPKEGEEKFCFDGINMAFAKIEQIELDDTSKPIYGKKKSTVCIDESSCYALIQPECETVDEVETCVNYCDSEGDGWYPIVAANYSEVYCSKHLGYEKKYIDQLVEDATLRAAHEQEKADKEAEKLAKKASKDAAKEVVKNCNKADDCLEAIKLLLGE